MSHLKDGFFIAFEGPDGSGKSTQALILSRRLCEDGYDSIVTEEPGGTEIGALLRDIILNPERPISERTELFLFLADRAEHVEKVVKPALQKGSIVVTSRYLFSTLVYQGSARKLYPYKELYALNRFAVDDILPDIVFCLDVAPEEGLLKATNNSKDFEGGDRIEREGLKLQRKVRESYLALARKDRRRWVVIQPSSSIEEISTLVYDETRRRMPV
ncbi:MAG: dTMP kinase [Spirochaetes bacterium]|nr:dTMP kinase [Spirochaetota bacterium]